MKMYRAMVAKDIPALSEVLDDSFVLVHMTGMRQPKAAFLKAVANGTLNYASADHDSMDVTVRELHAALIGKAGFVPQSSAVDGTPGDWSRTCSW